VRRGAAWCGLVRLGAVGEGARLERPGKQETGEEKEERQKRNGKKRDRGHLVYTAGASWCLVHIAFVRMLFVVCDLIHFRFLY
jgi:hypothetical protein